MWMIAVVLAGVGGLLFVLPHHRGYESSASLAKDFRELVTEGQIESPGALVMVALAFVGSLGVLLPGLIAAVIALLPDRATRGGLIAGGVVLVLAASAAADVLAAPTGGGAPGAPADWSSISSARIRRLCWLRAALVSPSCACVFADTLADGRFHVVLLVLWST